MHQLLLKYTVRAFAAYEAQTGLQICNYSAQGSRLTAKVQGQRAVFYKEIKEIKEIKEVKSSSLPTTHRSFHLDPWTSLFKSARVSAKRDLCPMRLLSMLENIPHP
jgi:hypothetical protein